MRIAYFDCSSGIAGDMIISSLISAGLDSRRLEKAIKNAIRQRNTGMWRFSVKRTEKKHFPAVSLDVMGEKVFPAVGSMIKTVRESRLPDSVKEKSCRIFSLIGQAESAVHKNKHPELHEMGSIDTLIDVIGACAGMEMMGIDKVYASPLNMGVPAPATLFILKNRRVPAYTSGINVELTTPTGAAVISALAAGFGELPSIEIERYGFGAGSFDLNNGHEHGQSHGWGNADILRVIIGKTGEKFAGDRLVVLETNIDDMDTRVYPFLIEKLLAEGALDAWVTNILMKKGRPAFKLNVLCVPEKENRLLDVIFRETTTLGVRKEVVFRPRLERMKKGGVKAGVFPDGSEKYQAEYSSALSRKKSGNKAPLYKLLKPQLRIHRK